MNYNWEIIVEYGQYEHGYVDVFKTVVVQKGSKIWQPTERERKSSGCKDGDGHAICVVAYDDDQFGGAFRVMNSWGPNWADGGFVWVRYNDFAQYSTWGVEISNP